MLMCEGCVNGGGQIKLQDDASSKELYQKAESIYSSVRFVVHHTTGAGTKIVYFQSKRA